jgi:hypothetical protein
VLAGVAGRSALALVAGSQGWMAVLIVRYRGICV